MHPEGVTPSPFSHMQAIRVFFMLRSLSLQLRAEPETQLPLTREEDLIKTDDVLDLSEWGRWAGSDTCSPPRCLALSLRGVHERPQNWARDTAPEFCV